MKNSYEYDAFISYQRKDSEQVRCIYEYLKKEEGLSIWLDSESLGYGNDFLKEIPSALLKSRNVLIFINGEPNRYQSEEISIALKAEIETKEISVIPVFLPNSSLNDISSFPSLGTRNWVDLRRGLLDIKSLIKLSEKIRGETIVPVYENFLGGNHKDNLPLGYQADVGKIISLLIGESLYSRKDVCIRELIQNAVDACERRREYAPYAPMEIIVRISSKEGYFEVDDSGEGMSPYHLSHSFSVVGKSIRDEKDVIKRITAADKDRLYLIGKFGIGFISSYILSDRIVISTTYDGEDQINFEIKDISSQYTYYEESILKREKSRLGTTVRLYLKNEFQAGRNEINIVQVIKDFCRHVPYLKVFEDGKEIPLNRDWNIEENAPFDVYKEPRFYEMHLGAKKGGKGFLASNAGFLISDNPIEIMPKYMPLTIGGEINLYPGILELNMSRDKIVKNDQSDRIADEIFKSIKKMIIQETERYLSGSKKRVTSDEELIEILMLCIKYSESSTEKGVPNQQAFLNEIEAAERLLDIWKVSFEGKYLSFREAITLLKSTGKNRIYYQSKHYYRKPDEIEELFKKNLIARGFLVIDSSPTEVICTSKERYRYTEKDILDILKKTYDFEVLSVQDAYEKDLKEILVPRESLSLKLRKMIDTIEARAGIKIQPVSMDGAPPCFDLPGKKCLNMKSRKISKINTEELRDESVLLGYLRGLLQLDFDGDRDNGQLCYDLQRSEVFPLDFEFMPTQCENEPSERG